MSDKIEKIGDSVVQYGPHNDRINVMELSVHDMPDIVYNLDRYGPQEQVLEDLHQGPRVRHR